jgi:hypothetical protein
LSSGNEILLISIENECVEMFNSIAEEIGAAVAVVTTPQELKTVLIMQHTRRNAT